MAPTPSQQDLQAQALAMYLRSDQARLSERQIHKEKAADARRPLMWLAFLHIWVTVFIYLRLAPAVNAGKPPAVAAIVALAIITFAYWLLWTWSDSNPLAAAVTGLLLYTASSIVVAGLMVQAQEGVFALPIGLIGLVCIVLLTRAIMSGSKFRRMEIADRETTADHRAALRPGIASAIWLFVVLLLVQFNTLLGVAAHTDPSVLVRGEMAVQAFVIVAWAIASWRVVLPAYLRWPEAKWFAQAIVLGVATSLLAMIYLRLAHQELSIPTLDLGAVFSQFGYGLLGIVLMTCAFPAIFEELAFRGIIVPVLQRALTKWETIFASAAMFMILHLSVFSFPHLLCLGMALAYVRIRTRSIWPCVLMHFTHNVMCLWLT
ncbi:MAG TPA: type II CAAX endopeptidase family protein [Tepidisphaeraceae bacterium]|nr:type II CAAX endopeptidase family protein [Tepidisphaeraceae bacterium]